MILRFGTSGIPRSSPRPDTVHGIRRARALGLDCLEMAWVNGIRMGAEAADRIAGAARESGLALTAHAPYFLNLCGAPDVALRSLDRLLDTLRLGARCGARSVCFHAGFYQRLRPAEARRRIERALRVVTERLRAEGLDIDVRPELTGKPSQVGSLEELLDWSAEIPGVRPCVDFSHQYARSGGAFNCYEDFTGMLDLIAARLGRESLDRLHVHVSGIEFGPRGERRHLPLRKSRFRYRELLRALRDRGVAGWLVCESPVREDDALHLQRVFRRLG